MKPIVLIITAIIGGFLGGVLGARMSRVPPDGGEPSQVVRAQRFELVNPAGQVISLWGIDSGSNVILAFGGAQDTIKGQVSASGGPHLMDPHSQRVAIGITDDAGFVYFRGKDGNPRVSLGLSLFEKPQLIMDDETGPRLRLGVPHSDTPGPEDNTWMLLFEPNRASIGMSTVKRDGRSYVGGFSFVADDKVESPPKSGR